MSTEHGESAAPSAPPNWSILSYCPHCGGPIFGRESVIPGDPPVVKFSCPCRHVAAYAPKVDAKDLARAAAQTVIPVDQWSDEVLDRIAERIGLRGNAKLVPLSSE